VILTKLSTGESFEGLAYREENDYEAIWNEGGLRCVFHFDASGKQIGMNDYVLSIADTP
jgi:hypothetical protein